VRRPAVLTLIAASLAIVSAPSNATDYAPFDPARIGLPALTDLGIDYLIEQHKRLIEDARREIAALQASDLSNAAEVIARYEETIREEFRQIARLAGQRTSSARSLATAGSAADLPALRGLLTTVLQASRFNQLMGNEADAQAQWQAVVQIATTYASSFRQNCFGQVFKQELALGLDRQQDMLGTGIDVTPCAKRRFSIELAGFKFENCSIWTDGEWELERHDRYAGKGKATLTLNESRTATEGDWALEFSGGGVTGSDGGQMRVAVTETRSPTGEVSRNYKLHLTFDSMNTRAGGHAADVTNEPAKYFPVKMSETPCRNAQG
jgi:hypothetical protein